MMGELFTRKMDNLRAFFTSNADAIVDGAGKDASPCRFPSSTSEGLVRLAGRAGIGSVCRTVKTSTRTDFGEGELQMTDIYGHFGKIGLGSKAANAGTKGIELDLYKEEGRPKQYRPT